LPGLTQYGYRDAMSGFFEFPTENARRILPPNLEPGKYEVQASVDFQEGGAVKVLKRVVDVTEPPPANPSNVPRYIPAKAAGAGTNK